MDTMGIGTEDPTSKQPKLPQCASCTTRRCGANAHEEGSREGVCMLEETIAPLYDDLASFYQEGLPARIMAASDATMGQSYSGKWDHFQEIVEFSRQMGFTRIGIATCISFYREAGVLARKLKDEGFTVYSAICKTGELCKGDVGLDTPHPEHAACNPALQARLLNDAHTELNLVLGLCVGHDALFNKLSEGLVSTYFSKCFAHDHNAIADLR